MRGRVAELTVMNVTWGVLRGLAVVALLLAVPVGCSCSRAEEPNEPVTVDLQAGWSVPGADPEEINSAAAAAREKGNGEVADLLVFYAGVSGGAGDVVSVVTAADGRAVLAVRRHGDTTTPLDQVVARHASEVTSQGGAVNTVRVIFHEVPAWEVVYAGAPAGLRDVTYWFDRAGGRFTVEITGKQADVNALAAAVRIA